MKFSNEDLKLWKQKIDAGRVIAHRVTLHIEGTKNDSPRYRGLCPFHEEKTPSFDVYREEDSWIYHCLGCGAKGNVFQFFEKIDGLKFPDAVDKVLELSGNKGWEAGKEIVNRTFGNPFKKQHKEYETFSYDQYKQTEAAFEKSVEAQKWVTDRGLSLDAARRLHWGFVQSVKAVSSGHPWAERGWISIPTLSDDGKTVTAVKYRSLVAKKGENGESGFLRAKGTSTTLYNAREVNPLEDVFIVEGEPDTVAILMTGNIAVGLPSAEYNVTPDERDRLMKAPRRFLAGDCDAGVGSKAMMSLWKELRDNTFLIEWPDNLKDANDVLKIKCQGDVEKFTELLEELKSNALAKPIPDYYDVSEAMENIKGINLMDHPNRLHFRDKAVDEMAVNLPGAVVSIYASYTGSGKTTWCLDQFAIPESMHGTPIAYYSAELSVEEMARIIASNVQGEDRLKIDTDSFRKAAKKLKDAETKLYIGYNPDLNRINLVLDSIEWAIRRLGLKIVVIDHLHFLCRNERDDIKAQADAMQRIKNIATKLGVLMVVVGQSRKEQPSRRSRPSEISDAKGSETFTSDATTTYLIHRNVRRDIDWDHPETWPIDLLDSRTEIRLIKCRTKGPGKAVTLQKFHGAYCRFEPLTERPPEDMISREGDDEHTES